MPVDSLMPPLDRRGFLKAGAAADMIWPDWQ
jgi:hypothetical protein